MNQNTVSYLDKNIIFKLHQVNCALVTNIFNVSMFQ